MGTSDVRVSVRKFDGSLHWHHTMTRLGEDEHGVWLGAPIGTVYGKGPVTEVYATEERRVMLFPRNAWWTALFHDAPAHLDVYCDVTTPPQWMHAGEVTTVDLDLDVCRIRADGSVFVDDEDEFALHKDRYGYPPDVIASAESAAASLTAALRDAREPFAGRYRHWLRRVGRLGADGEQRKATS
jgi:protein associated with RNAse G/E